MFFDPNGYPRDTGATDYMDSARLAGLMATFGLELKKDILIEYILRDEQGQFVGVRCPNEEPSNNPKNFTRDQLVCLVSGLYFDHKRWTASKLFRAARDRNSRAQNTEADYPGTVKKFPDGADLLTPSVMDHLRMCADVRPTLLGSLWLKMDIMFNGKFTPMREPNQLICMCMVAGPKYVEMYKKYNPKYAEAIRYYWSGWRGEPELAEHMINVLNKNNT